MLALFLDHGPLILASSVDLAYSDYFCVVLLATLYFPHLLYFKCLMLMAFELTFDNIIK